MRLGGVVLRPRLPWRSLAVSLAASLPVSLAVSLRGFLGCGFALRSIVFRRLAFGRLILGGIDLAAARRAFRACRASAWQPTCGRREPPAACLRLAVAAWRLRARGAGRTGRPEAIELLRELPGFASLACWVGLEPRVSVAPLEIRKALRLRGHLAGGGIMLAQEARQRSEPARSSTGRAALLWQAVQVPEKIWEGLLPASRFCARTGHRRETADQKRHRR